MIDNKRVLAIIPARGGSKRVPRKNILDLASKPLIVWTIDAALKSEYIDRVVVSTDDKEIAEISKKNGADVPFMRPVELASDSATSIDAVRHAIKALESLNEYYDYLILLQPTSPLRTEKYIDDAIELLIEKKAECIVSICEVDHPVEWTGILPESQSMNNFFPKELQGKRSQDFQTRYRINGAIYIVNIKQALEQKSLILNELIYGFIMQRKDSIDIDEYIDFKIAEVIMSKNVCDHDLCSKTLTP